MSIELSIIIPVYNNANFTKNCIQDLLKLPADHEIIIVDNASTDHTSEVVHEFLNKKNNGAQLIYIGCPRNLGFGAANNKAFKQACGENILFLNNDIRVKSNHETWTKDIINLCEEGYLISGNGGLLDGGGNFIRETNDHIDSPYFYLSGWSLAASKRTFDRLVLKTDEIEGPWNTKFFAYFEDVDLSWRAKELNIPLKVINLPVHHFGRMTGKKLGISNLYTQSQQIFRELWKTKISNS